MRYNTNDYLWINDSCPVMVMHPIKLSADELAGLAKTLNHLVRRFKV